MKTHDENLINTFKKDWSAEDFKAFPRKVLKFFNAHAFQYNQEHGATFKPLRAAMFSSLDSLFGFAYTSTGVCAGSWACNAFNLQSSEVGEFNMLTGFVVDNSGQWFAWFEDINENNLFITI